MPDLLPGLQFQAALQPQLRPPQPHDARIVSGAGGSGGTRLGQNAQQDHGAARQGPRVEPPPDPDPPTGPPPAFAANILEAAKKHRRDGPDPLAGMAGGTVGPRQADGAVGQSAAPRWIDFKL